MVNTILHKIGLLCFALFLGFAASAQTEISTFDDRNYQQIFDSLTSGLIKSRIPHGTLYDRVYPWADMKNWASGDALSSSKIRQIWWDMEQSRVPNPNSPTTVPNRYEALRDSSYLRSLRNEIDIWAIDFQVSLLDSVAFTDGRLSKVNGILTDNNSLGVPYKEQDIKVAALSSEQFSTCQNYTLRLSEANFLSNRSGARLKKIVVSNLSNNTSSSIGMNGSASVSFSSAGKNTLDIAMIFLDGSESHVTQTIKIDDCSTATERNDCTANLIIESDIPFKGYDERSATTSLANATIYYGKIPNSTLCNEKLKKPIIILDGFDPLDGRKVDQVYKMINAGDATGDKLYDMGYDVVVLNFPVLGSGAVNNRSDIKERSASGVLSTVNIPGRDGGADYIERNAFLLVKLIQDLNESLRTNGNTEKLRIVGPSMGGQISRYALAYMEKQDAAGVANMKHNTKLWVSFDSPHDGANIPMGVQQAILFLGDFGGDQSASNLYRTTLRSPAASQMLIEQELRPATYTNNSAPYRQTWINTLNSGGLSGSNGYPTSLRKVTLINGSSTGKLVNNPGELFLNFEAIKSGFTVFEVRAKFMGVTGEQVKTFRGRFSTNSSTATRDRDVTNANPRSSMDVMPGGLYNSQGPLYESILEGLNKKKNDKKITKFYNDSYKPNHCFIPSISALGFRTCLGI